MAKSDLWGAIGAPMESVCVVVRYNLIKGVFASRTTCTGNDGLYNKEPKMKGQKTRILPTIFTLVAVPAMASVDQVAASSPMAQRISLVNTGEAGHYAAASGEAWFFRADGLFVRYMNGQVVQLGRWVLSADGTQVMISAPGAPPVIYALETLEAILKSMDIAAASARIELLQGRFAAFYHS
jgi:hypothetical protein